MLGGSDIDQRWDKGRETLSALGLGRRVGVVGDGAAGAGRFGSGGGAVVLWLS